MSICPHVLVLNKIDFNSVRICENSIQIWENANCETIIYKYNIVTAYEPVWAIGTGKVATPEQAEETQKFVSEYLGSKLPAEVHAGIRIIYGGSVSDTNCGELIKGAHIDGFLIGGASLKSAFKTIVETVAAYNC